MQRQTTGMPYLLTDKQCIQQINTEPNNNLISLHNPTPTLTLPPHPKF